MASDETTVVIIGTSYSSATQSALPIISEPGLLMISPTNTFPALMSTDREAGGVWRPGFYRITPNHWFQGLLAGQFAFRDLGVRRVATVHDGGADTKSLTGVLRETFVELGGGVVVTGSTNISDSGYVRRKVISIEAIILLRSRFACRQRH